MLEIFCNIYIRTVQKVSRYKIESDEKGVSDTADYKAKRATTTDSMNVRTSKRFLFFLFVKPISISACCMFSKCTTKLNCTQMDIKHAGYMFFGQQRRLELDGTIYTQSYIRNTVADIARNIEVLKFIFTTTRLTVSFLAQKTLHNEILTIKEW